MHLLVAVVVGRHCAVPFASLRAPSNRSEPSITGTHGSEKVPAHTTTKSHTTVLEPVGPRVGNQAERLALSSVPVASFVLGDNRIYLWENRVA